MLKEIKELPELLTPKQVMEYLQISKPTFFRWTKDGRLKHSKIGGLIRVQKTELLKLLN